MPRRTHCSSCEYELAGLDSATMSRCPECGAGIDWEVTEAECIPPRPLLGYALLSAPLLSVLLGAVVDLALFGRGLILTPILSVVALIAAPYTGGLGFASLCPSGLPRARYVRAMAGTVLGPVLILATLGLASVFNR